MLKIYAAVVAVSFMLAGAAQAQTDPNMKCSDYIALAKQMGTYGKPSGDKDADALEKKVDDYCIAHPSALATEAIAKAMGQ